MSEVCVAGLQGLHQMQTARKLVLSKGRKLIPLFMLSLGPPLIETPHDPKVFGALNLNPSGHSGWSRPLLAAHGRIARGLRSPRVLFEPKAAESARTKALIHEKSMI